ncbi:putative carnitine O-palmitoyltransferase [Trypanosoma grayi]|uniref:putative carnitine O-palmitoyltransferase n=1 Tax=Trypanosoma grayi TaxID=71804 RepID=UPI0004F46328|nr:putative carnitine O-palmitoyltransferase [Trypanosoma grayi]KEG09669.1 putative carnitine O-palmitoyltransferase [Trypanosoma grayi]
MGHQRLGTNGACAHLPLPSITTVLQRYVEFVEPLDGVENKQASIDFIRKVLGCLQTTEGNTRSEVHDASAYFRLLESLAQKYKHFCNASLRTSHMAPLWNAMYLGNRDPLPFGWNYMLHLEGPSLERSCRELNVSPQALRAAIIGAASFHVRRLVNQPLFFTPEAQKHLPKSFRVDLTLCRDQFTRLFRTVRIPHEGMDGLRWSCTENVLLLSKGHLYILRWLRFNVPEDMEGLGPCWLEEVIANARLIDAVISETSSLAAKEDSPLVLASGCRRNWARVFDELWNEPTSKVALADITSCSFALALDSEVDIRLGLHGGKHPENRYPDMNVVYTVNPAGDACCNMEHSWGDGSSMTVVSSSIYYYAASLCKEHITPQKLEEMRVLDHVAHVKAVSFGPLSSSALHAIAEARRVHLQQVDQVDMTERCIRAFGTNEIKKHCRVSPDSFMHAAFHLAQRRLFGDQRSTYCALLMKKYHHGRTETLRTVTLATQALADAVQSLPNTHTFSPKVAEALQNVSKEHRRRILSCREGQGFHRTATLLRRLHNEVRERLQYGESSHFSFDIAQASAAVDAFFFTSPAYRELTSDYLSTSNITAVGIASFAFTVTHPDGVGIGYSLFSDHLAFTSSSSKAFARPLRGSASGGASKEESVCVAYADTLERAVRDLYRLTASPLQSKL